MIAALLASILLSAPGDLETEADRGRFALAGQAAFETPVPWLPIELRLRTGDDLALDLVLATDGACEAWFRDLRSTLKLPDLPDSPLGLAPGEQRVLRLSCEALTVQSVSLLAGAVGAGGAAVAAARSVPEPDRPSEVLASASAPAETWGGALGRTVLHLGAGGSASLVPPGDTTVVRAMARSLDGGRLWVMVGGPDGEPVARVPLDPRWRWRGPVCVRAHEGTPIIVRAEGGSVDVDNVEAGPHQTAFVAETGETASPTLELAGALRLVVASALSSPGQLAAAHRFVSELPAPASESVPLLGVPVTLDDSLPPQGYRLSVSEGGAALAAADPFGAQWGLQEAADRVCRGPSGSALLAGSAEGAPALLWRGAEISLGGEGELEPALRSLVDCRFTHVLLDGPQAGFLHDPMLADQLAGVFELAVPLGLTPVPVLRAWGEAVLRDRPMLAEGTTAEPERPVLAGSAPAALSHPNVIATAATRPEVTDPDTSQVFEEGADYVLVPGETLFGPTGFDTSARRWSIARTESGRIADGQVVKVSYDYVAATGTLSVAACPSEPELLSCLRDDLARLVAATHPSAALLDFGPASAPGTDRRCTGAHRPVADATVRIVRELALQARGLDPDLKVIVSVRALGEPSALGQVPGNVVLLAPATSAAGAWAGRGRSIVLLDEDPGDGSPAVAKDAASLSGGGCIGALAVLRPSRAPGVENEAAVAYWRGGR